MVRILVTNQLQTRVNQHATALLPQAQVASSAITNDTSGGHGPLAPYGLDRCCIYGWIKNSVTLGKNRAIGFMKLH